MEHSKRRLGRQPSKQFGKYLRYLREHYTDLSQAQAARKALLRPEELNYFEQGNRVAPDYTLIKLAQLYKVPPNEILGRAYWPQLMLLPLAGIVEPDKLSKEVIEALEKGLDEADREQLTRFIERLLRKRTLATRH